MTLMLNKLLIIAVLFLGGFSTGNALAASDSIKEGGIGGTGMPAMRGGIGGTGATMDGGIGGTGLLPNEEPAMPTLAGKVLFIVGQVEAQNLGQVRLLAKGDPVRVGDTLKSGNGASLQLRMEDGGTIVLRPESQLAIETFVYKGVQDGGEHMALALLSGGFRAVTGDIGHLHKENYSIRTPNAKVGILGTDHETVFVPTPQPGQTAAVEPGTYNHVISGATVLQSEKGNLLIGPNQTGYAALNGTSPIILDRPLPIFGNQKANPEERGDQHGDMNNSGQERKINTDFEGSMPGAERHSSSPMSNAEQNTIAQPDHLANTTLDLNTLETDALPAVPGSAVVGAHMAAGLLAVGTALAGNSGENLLVEENMPSSYSNNATGFNFIDNQAKLLDHGVAQVDGVNVTWGVYAGGTTFDTSGKAIAINYHSFAYANEGATPLAVVRSMSGNATFSNAVGYTKPVTESGNIGGIVNLNVGINLGTSIVTSYNLAVTDTNSRNWAGTLNNGSVPLSTFARNGTPLAVTCVGCGSGTASGSAAGILVGPNAKGMISSYALGTTMGQAVAGTVVMSRP